MTVTIHKQVEADGRWAYLSTWRHYGKFEGPIRQPRFKLGTSRTQSITILNCGNKKKV
jgi:hypothetical protein